MSKRQIRAVPFWRLVLRFGIIFLIIVSIIQIMMELFKNRNLQAVTDTLENGEWVNYLFSHLLLGLVYGIAMAYFTKRKAQKG